MTDTTYANYYERLLGEARDKPSAESYRAFLHLSFARNSDDGLPIAYAHRALQTLDFEAPPVDLSDWYEHWFHLVKLNPVELDVQFQSENLAWLLCTLGRTVGFASVELSDGNTPYPNDKPGVLGKFGLESQRLGAIWIDKARELATTHPLAIVEMCALLGWRDRTLFTGHPIYNLWTGVANLADMADFDMSAHMLRLLFSERRLAVELIIDMHDSHDARCKALRVACSPKANVAVFLPAD